MFNVFRSVSSPIVFSGTTITDWFYTIQSTGYSNSIITYRNVGDENIKHSLPCITYSFQFNGYKKDENIIDSTGYLFFDIDNPNFDINTIDKSRVAGYYLSISGKHYHIVAKIKNLTVSNFRDAYLFVAKELGISEFIDLNAIKKTQYSIISYDPNIFINNEPIEFVYTEDVKKGIINCIGSKKNTIRESMIPFYTNQSNRIYTDNSLQIWEERKESYNQEYIYFPDRTSNYIKLFLPSKKIYDGRKRSLKSFLTNLFILNPEMVKINPDKLFKYAKGYTESYFGNQLDENIFNQIFREKVKELNEGKLRPLLFKKQRMVLFNPYMKIDLERKQSIVFSLIQKEKKSKKIELIKTFIDTYISDLNDRKINNKFISENLGFSTITVKRLMKEIKQDEYYAELIEMNHSKFQTRMTKYNKQKKQNNMKKSEIKSETITPEISGDNIIVVLTTSSENKGNKQSKNDPELIVNVHNGVSETKEMYDNRIMNEFINNYILMNRIKVDSIVADELRRLKRTSKFIYASNELKKEMLDGVFEKMYV